MHAGEVAGAAAREDSARLFSGLALVAIGALAVAGVLGWVLMGPTLFHLMATGIGWLCM